MEAPAALAREALAHLRWLESSGAPGFFAEVCRQFTADAPARVARLEAAMAAGDATLAEREAHSLKSMAALIGATDMASYAAELELAVMRGELARGPEAAAWLRTEIGRVERALALELGERPSVAP